MIFVIYRRSTIRIVIIIMMKQKLIDNRYTSCMKLLIKDNFFQQTYSFIFSFLDGNHTPRMLLLFYPFVPHPFW